MEKKVSLLTFTFDSKIVCITLRGILSSERSTSNNLLLFCCVYFEYLFVLSWVHFTSVRLNYCCHNLTVLIVLRYNGCALATQRNLFLKQIFKRLLMKYVLTCGLMIPYCYDDILL